MAVNDILVIAMFVTFVAFLFTGLPVAFVLGGVGVLFAGVGYLSDQYLGTVTGLDFLTLGLVVNRIYKIMDNWVLVAIPVFIFMGLMLDRSGVAGRMMHAMARLFGQVRGGLAVTVTLMGMILAASTGIIGASVVLLGTLSLSPMLRQGYGKPLATGTICGAGCLGILLPPSIMLVIMADQLALSVGDLFMGAVFPGLVLGGLYLAYILVASYLDPASAPLPQGVGVTVENHRRTLLRAAPLPWAAPAQPGLNTSLNNRQQPDSSEEDNQRTLPRAAPLPWAALWAVVKSVIPPVLLILAVLGSIFAGIATPTEASGIGALGATALAGFNRRLNLAVIREALMGTYTTTAYIFAIFMGATCFSLVLRELGGDEFIEAALTGLPFGQYGALFAILAAVFLLGFLLDWVEITLIVLPLLAPVVAGLHFGIDGHGVVSEPSLIWFIMLVAVTLQTSFLTPPVGFALFYLKGVCPPEVRLTDIYRGVLPFIVLQLIGLGIVLLFPQLVVWLPAMAYR
uniref:TRAP transporter, DctM subunit n=1 Tax=Candidatus Kentrum eta TaxID=2126337 RepID=A0A450UTK7_9GAMM|nr:MAG: TRAP transporter, DctM subunit [Candidatus Kentron sp. H]VFJ97709.1 MAG: TRAP transporter, DctM subunit [Candidatus Kentron sp. H]VFK02947.1 MAG: TRAP transporter, DctM subunit [Candidatus Kentron sp. H]